MQLTPLIEHIKKLIDITNEQENKLRNIPFSKINRMLGRAICNYRNGLLIIQDGLIGSLTKKAATLSSLPTKSGKPLTADQIIFSIYQELVSSAYSTAEYFNTSVALLLESGISWELYYWLLEIPQSFHIDKLVVFQQGTLFITQTFKDEIAKPLNPLIEIAKDPNVPGSLIQIKSVDLLKTHPIEDGYIITCIRSEADNPIMWPILCHEMFELVDIDQGSTGSSLVQQFEIFVKTQMCSVPILNADKHTNEKWLLELLMDFLAITSFGPMYAKALLEFCQRSPYYPTPEYPEMCFRIYCAYLYLTSPVKSDSDIFGRCQTVAKAEVQAEVSRYEDEGNLDNDKETNISELYHLMFRFRKTIKTPTFVQRLDEYIAQSQISAVKLKDLLKKDVLDVEGKHKFIPFKDPLLTFDNITNTVMFHHISLAIDPNILLNVVIANYQSYNKDEHYEVIIDSIKKWKIKNVWNFSIQNIK